MFFLLLFSLVFAVDIEVVFIVVDVNFVGFEVADIVLCIHCCDRFFCCFSSFCSLCYNTYINRITFTKISCSSNGDTSISQTEWTSCLGVSKGEI